MPGRLAHVTTPEAQPVPVALLYAAVNARRVHLGWTWRDVENATGLTYETFRSWATATVNRSPHAGTLRSIERGIGWRPGSVVEAMGGGQPVTNPAWRALPGMPPQEVDHVGSYIATWLADHGALPSLEQVVIALGGRQIDHGAYTAACAQAVRDADHDRAALKSLALEPATLQAVLARYDCGDGWVQEIASASRKVIAHDLDDAVRRMLLTAAAMAVTRVLEAQVREPDDLKRMVSQAGIH